MREKVKINEALLRKKSLERNKKNKSNNIKF